MPSQLCGQFPRGGGVLASDFPNSLSQGRQVRSGAQGPHRHSEQGRSAGARGLPRPPIWQRRVDKVEVVGDLSQTGHPYRRAVAPELLIVQERPGGDQQVLRVRCQSPVTQGLTQGFHRDAAVSRVPARQPDELISELKRVSTEDVVGLVALATPQRIGHAPQPGAVS